MAELTTPCLHCGEEFVPLGTDPGTCPSCGSNATPPAGDATVFDVRPMSHRESARATGEEAIEIVVSDDTDRLITYAALVPDGGREPHIGAIQFADDVVRRPDPGWPEDVVPDCVDQELERQFDTERARTAR